MGKASITIAVNAQWNGRQLESAEKAMERLSKLTAATSRSMTSDLAKQGGSWGEFGGKIYNVGKKIESVGNTLTRNVTVPITQLAQAGWDAASTFDTSLANVRKTADITEDQLQKLGDAALDLSTKQPVTADTILNIEALGAQLGVSNDQLQNFAETVSGLDIATNMDFETAGTQMAQFAKITQMSQDEFENYGSAIVDLGNHLATTESDISNMSLRLAGLTSSAKFSQADILGMAGAMSSLGINAESGGSAMTRIVANISKAVDAGSDSVQKYAEVAGMSADEFADKWRTKPIEAMEALVEGLGKSEESGKSMNTVLAELGINNVRDADAMRRLAGSGDTLKESVDRANQAWSDNTALTNEVDKRNESLESRMQVLQNKITAVVTKAALPLCDAFISIIEQAQPLFDALTSAAQGFADMDESGQRTVVMLAGIAAAAGPVLTHVGKFTQGVGTAVTALGNFQQSAAVYVDALNTADGAQLRNYASADTMATKLALSGNKAVEAAGGVENYVKAWEGMTDSAKRVGELEPKIESVSAAVDAASKKSHDAVDDYNRAVAESNNKLTDSVIATKKSAQAALEKENALKKTKEALVDEATAAKKSFDENANLVSGWSKSREEAMKAAKGVESLETSVANMDVKAKTAGKSSEGFGDKLKGAGEKVKRTASSFKDYAGALLSSIGPQLALSAGAAAIGLVVGAIADDMQKAKERQELLNGAFTSAGDIARSASGDVSALGDAYSNLNVDSDGVLNNLKQTNEDFAASMDDIYTKSARLDYAVGIIEDLGNKSGLSAAEQIKLKDAVDEYNQVTGSSVEVTDAANGKLSESVESITAAGDAWRYNAEQQAYAAAAQEYYQKQAEAAVELDKAEKELADVQQERKQVQDELNNSSSLSVAKRAELEQKNLDLQAKEDSLTQSVEDCRKAYDEAGESAEWLANRSEEMSSRLSGIKDVFSEWGDTVANALDGTGVSADAFAEKLAAAGISTERLNQIGSDNFAQLASECNGDIDEMVKRIATYNGTPLLDKDGKVNLDDASLVDAQGNVYTWNGSTLVDQNGKAVVNDTKLTDAQGNVYTWNNSTLKDKNGKVAVSTRSMDDAVGKWDGIKFGTKDAVVNVIQNISQRVKSATSHNAAGGIRTHADGGIRYHANGGSIVNNPGPGVPLDIVGEAGAEAIVPLTNKRYAMPFVKLIAGEINKGGGNAQPTVNNYVLNIDGVRANGNERAMQLMQALFDEFNLTADMGVR